MIKKRGSVVVLIAWQLDLQLLVQSVPITTKVVSQNPKLGRVYTIKHYVIKFISDLRQVTLVSDFLGVSSTKQTASHDITEILLKVVFRDRPFNLRGAMVFFFVQNIFFGQHESQNIYFFVAQSAKLFFQNLTLGYTTTTLNQIIFFSSTKI